eukprot:2200204-Amphidinium_carterae.5
MDFNEIVMQTGNEPYIEQSGYNEQTMRIGSHLYVAALVLPGLHNHEGSSIRATTIEATINQLQGRLLSIG